MDYFKEIRSAIEEFCNTNPASGFEINYLENATRIYELYAEANEIIEESEGIDNSRLAEICEEVRNLI